MKTSRPLLWACLTMAGGLTIFAAIAGAEGGQPTGLPDAVRGALENSYASFRILKTELETEDGVALYEVLLEQGSENLEVKLTASGKIVEEEREINPANLPAGIQEILTSAYALWKVEKAELAVMGEVRIYEVELSLAGSVVELKFNERSQVVEVDVEDSDEAAGVKG